MATMTGGNALAASLHREGVRVIFGLPGVQMYHAMDGLHRQPEIRFITTRHEQAAGYMADGYARASGEIGTALVVPGPGLQNASAVPISPLAHASLLDVDHRDRSRLSSERMRSLRCRLPCAHDSGDTTPTRSPLAHAG